MATNNVDTNTDKSLFAKAKDTLFGLKHQAEEFLFSQKNKSEIKGMSRAEFEATKAKLESSLHFKKQQFASGAQFQTGANVNMKYEEVNKQEFQRAPDVLFQKTQVVDDKKDELAYAKLDKNEVRVLPTLKLQEKPVIIEKEIEYEKPVEIKQTIIHQEKPIIIEKPIIKETHEHYREETQYERKNQKIVTESVSEQDTGNKDQEALLNLRKERIDSYNDTTPIVQYQKENVQLDTDFRQKPTEVREKEVVYQQPVEIQRTQIEKIIPKVREEVTLEKEHIHQKLAPEVYQEETRQVIGNDKYFSQDTTARTDLNNGAPINDASTWTNASNESYVAGEENRKQVM
jgi:hypothetical protein